MAEYHILGAGISGLCIGYFLKKAGHNVKIYEKNSISGGVIATEAVHEGLIHHGPHLMRINADLADFFQEIGVEMLPAVNTQKYIANICDGKIIKQKLGISEILKIIPHLFRNRKAEYHSLYDFAKYHYGDFVAQNFVQAICNGIYATSIENLDAEIALKKLYFTETKAIYKIFKSMWRLSKAMIATPKGGFGEIIHSLAKNLEENIVYNAQIDNLKQFNGNVIIAVPAFCASKFEGLPHGAKELLNNISYANVDVTTMFTKQEISMKGIGMLTPANNGVLGILFNSSAFYETHQNGYYSYSVFSKNLAESQITKIFSEVFAANIAASYYNSYKNSIPIYNSNVKQFIDYNNNLEGNVKFFSNYTGSVAIGEIITSAKLFAQKKVI